MTRNENKCHILQLVMQEKIDSKGRPGRRRNSWLINLQQWFEVSSIEIFRKVVNKSMKALMIDNNRNGLGTLEEEDKIQFTR